MQPTHSKCSRPRDFPLNGSITKFLFNRTLQKIISYFVQTVKIIINRLFAIHTDVQREKWSWKYLHLIVSKINIFGSLLPVPLLSSLPTLVPKEALVLLQGHRASRTASIQTQQLIKVPYSSSSGLSTDLLDQCFT